MTAVLITGASLVDAGARERTDPGDRTDPPGPTDVLAVDGRIVAIGSDAGAAAPADAQHIDAGGLLLAPGFIDLQLNGAMGNDCTADATSIWAVAAELPRFGVTAFLPTLVSADRATIEAAREVLRDGPPRDHQGAIPLGLHVEGPFLEPRKRGAHPLASLRAPDPAWVQGWSPETAVRIVTLAPELPGALDVAHELVAAGVVVSAGHSMATLAEARAGFDAGIRMVTHLFNAMPPLDHHAPGLVAAALADRRVTLGLIPDGIHVDATVVDLVWRLARPDRLAIVTDAMAALGMAPGRYRLGGADVETDGREARIGDTLAGSVLGMDEAVRNLAAFTGCTTAEAIRACTSVPAALLHDRERGAVEVGRRADLVLLTPELAVVSALVAGRVVHGSTRVGAR